MVCQHVGPIPKPSHWINIGLGSGGREKGVHHPKEPKHHDRPRLELERRIFMTRGGRKAPFRFRGRKSTGGVSRGGGKSVYLSDGWDGVLCCLDGDAGFMFHAPP